MSNFPPPTGTVYLFEPPPSLPPEILIPLQTARENWSARGYLICARDMVEIDEALDNLLAYQQAVEDFDRVFSDVS